MEDRRSLEAETANRPPKRSSPSPVGRGGAVCPRRADARRSGLDRVADKITEPTSTARNTASFSGAIGARPRKAARRMSSRCPSGWTKNQELQNAGGLAYLALLANNTPSAANIGAYANIVRERAS